MSANTRSTGINFDDLRSLDDWTGDNGELFDHVAIWDDWRLPELLDEEARENDAELAELVHMTLASAKGYQELGEIGRTEKLRTLTDVVLRQRIAMFHDIMKLLQQDYSRRYEHWVEALQTFEVDAATHCDKLMTMKANWRLAVWHYEQNNIEESVSYVLQAESLLEAAYIEASAVISERGWEQKFKGHAAAINGAGEVCADLKTELTLNTSNHNF